MGARAGRAPPICQEARAINSTAAWCPSIDPTATGEGAYSITLRAVDLAGNHTSTAPATIYVDGTAPLAASAYIRRQRTVTKSPDADLTWSVNLVGTVSDPALSDGNPGSGIITNTVMVQLIDEFGKPVADGAQQATISGSAWSIDYQMTGRHPVGYYSIAITAEDQVGNRATTTVGSLVLDTYAPTVDVDRDTLPGDVISQTTVITGSMIDVPEPGGAVAKYHFEPNLGLLEDGSGNGHHGSCTSCPTTSEGLFGTTLTFNRSLSQFVTVPATTAFDLTSYTASVWIRPTWTAGTMGYSPSIMGIRGSAGAIFSLSLRDNYSRLEIYTGASPMPSRAPAVSIAQNKWHHIAVAYNGSTFTLYLDGLPINTNTLSMGTVSNLPLVIGKTNSAFSQNYFSGDIDEAMVATACSPPRRSTRWPRAASPAPAASRPRWSRWISTCLIRARSSPRRWTGSMPSSTTPRPSSRPGARPSRPAWRTTTRSACAARI
jgi:hypothetical protein